MIDRLSARVAFSAAASCLVLAHHWLKFDAVGLGLIVVALAPWLAAFVQSAKLPGGWEFQFREVKEQQQRQGQEIARLKFLLEGFLTGDELRHLQRLTRDEPFLVRFDATSKYFEAELRRLRALGLVSNPPGKGVRSLLVDDGQARDVRDHFCITEKGREYLALRDAGAVV